jgi:hypothetical protein
MMGGGGSSFFSSGKKNSKANLSFKAGYIEHLKNVQRFDRDTGKGIIGGHNLNEFYDYFKNVLNLKESEFIYKITKHPVIDGIIQIDYKVPKLNNKGELTGEYKYFKVPKTAYDPTKISDNMIVKWGKEAMEQGVKNGNVAGRKVNGVALNGLRFEGFMNTSGVITNFYPILD